MLSALVSVSSRRALYEPEQIGDLSKLCRQKQLGPIQKCAIDSLRISTAPF